MSLNQPIIYPDLQFPDNINDTQPWEEPARMIFGSAARYEVGVWIARRTGALFAPKDITKETGRYRSNILGGAVYTHFTKLKMIEELPSHETRSLYVRRAHRLWDVYIAASEILGAPGVLGMSEDEFRDQLLDMRRTLR